jgi:hypothetical protein
VQASESPRFIRVNPRARQPLVAFMVDGLKAAGCRILKVAPPNVAPFRISFELPSGERMGILAYVAFANDTVIRKRPPDEHRCQLKYGSKGPDNVLELWQDPYGLYTTLLLGINPERGFFVAADPVFRNPTKMFVSLAYWKERDAAEILQRGWYAWERGVAVRDEMKDHTTADEDPVEVLIGGTRDTFLRYVLLERDALGLDVGHRHLAAETLARPVVVAQLAPVPAPSPARLHELASELAMTEREVLDLIARTPRLKMAVRGWAAEQHLANALDGQPGTSGVHVVSGQGETDVALQYRGRPIRIQCKNVLRVKTRDNLARMDFQRTRASKTDECSRYYAPSDFDVVAACLHAVEETWTFRYCLSRELDEHPRCAGKLWNNVRIDQRWSADPLPVLARVG